MHKLKNMIKLINSIKIFLKSLFLFKPRFFLTLVFIPILYIIGWLLSLPLLLLNFEKENLSLIGTIFTLILFIFSMPSWFNIRWEIRNTWTVLGLNKKNLLENILHFSQGIFLSLILIILILIPILNENYIIWLGGLSSKIIINGILLTFGVGFAEELIFRAWLLEELKLQFGIKIALISQAIVFSIAHIQSGISFWDVSGTLIGLFLLAILCSIIRFKDAGSLWGAIGLHGGLVGIWFILNNGLIEISNETPIWLVGNDSKNPLGSLYGISLLTISSIFYFLNFKSQILKSIKYKK